jgi:hypothetical protein
MVYFSKKSAATLVAFLRRSSMDVSKVESHEYSCHE